MEKKKTRNEFENHSQLPLISVSKKLTEEDVLNVMQQLAENGIVETTSRVLSNQLGFKPDAGRQRVRAMIKKLEKTLKVEVSEKLRGRRKEYIYRLVKGKNKRSLYFTA